MKSFRQFLSYQNKFFRFWNLHTPMIFSSFYKPVGLSQIKHFTVKYSFILSFPLFLFYHPYFYLKEETTTHCWKSFISHLWILLNSDIHKVNLIPWVPTTVGSTDVSTLMYSKYIIIVDDYWFCQNMILTLAGGIYLLIFIK